MVNIMSIIIKENCDTNKHPAKVKSIPIKIIPLAYNGSTSCITAVFRNEINKNGTSRIIPTNITAATLKTKVSM